jgi:hypothetical protein
MNKNTLTVPRFLNFIIHLIFIKHHNFWWSGSFLFFRIRDETDGSDMNSGFISSTLYILVIRLIRSRRMRWAGHVTRMGRREVYTWCWWGNLSERDHLEDLGVNVRITLRWISGSGLGRHGLDCYGLEWGQVADTCECGHERSVP